MPRGARGGGGGGRRGGAGGGGGGARRKPISGKQKKEQLKAKKLRKQQRRDEEEEEDDENNEEGDSSGEDNDDAGAANAAVRYTRSGKDSKLTSLFLREEDEDVQARRRDAERPLNKATRGEKLYAHDSVDLGFPQRPPWDRSMTPEELDAQETAVFEKWLASVHGSYSRHELPPFEHNLEVWRQLWRTLEKSDMMMVVADVRNPLLHLPRALYRHITEDKKLPLLVCLTKVDIVEQAHVDRWMDYLRKHYPKANPFPFSNRVHGPHGKFMNERGGVHRRRRLIANKLTQEEERIVHEHSTDLLEACLSLSRPRQGESLPDSRNEPMIGIVGQPNVGKSSVVNSLIGEKVVSVSRSVGHTKHWQTHYVRRGGEVVAQICDSPGLIFPVIWKHDTIPPRHVYECSGLYPIPQIRETFSAIRFLAEHLPIELLYNLKLDVDDYGPDWSPYAILGSFADKNGYSADGGGPDFHRAGLEILRDVVDGLILVSFEPPEGKPSDTIALEGQNEADAEVSKTSASAADSDVDADADADAHESESESGREEEIAVTDRAIGTATPETPPVPTTTMQA